MKTRVILDLLEEKLHWTSKKAPEKWLLELGWSQKKFYRIVTGEQTINLADAYKLAKLIGCETEELVDYVIQQ